jgi:excisionase family DNA binding protein
MTQRALHKVVAFADQRDQVATAAADAFGNVRLTVAQAAAEAAVSEHTIRRAYVHGHLPVHRFGLGARSLRIKRSELMAWLEAGGNTAARDGQAR